MANSPKNRERGSQGQVLILDAKFYEYSGGLLVDDDNYSVNGTLPKVVIYDPSGNVYSDSSVSGALQPVRINVGEYQYNFDIPINATISDAWKIEWTVTINNNTIPFSELFTVVSAGSVTFGEEDFRIGFAFNNPDLTSTHHATLWDNNQSKVVGWGLIVTPDEMRYMLGFGSKLTATDANQTFDDNMLMYYIDNAIAMLERDLNIDILPKVVRHEDPYDMSQGMQGGSLVGESSTVKTQGSRTARVDLPSEQNEPNRIREQGYPYRVNNANNYLFIKLRRRPLIDVLKSVMIDPIQNQIIDIYAWRKEHSGFESKVQFFPNIASVGTYPFIPTNLSRISYPFPNFPDSIYIDYRTGYLNCIDVPKEFRSVIMWVAAIPFLLDFGRRTSALASASVNLNSISESFSTTMSATSTLYGADIIQYQKMLKEWWTKNAHKYRRDTIGVL